VINISGAFLLGWLLAAFATAGPENDQRMAIRLFVGTGVLGGYTTYSMFAVNEDGLIDSGQFSGSLIYGPPTIALGVVAASAGAALARVIHTRSIRAKSQQGTLS